MCPSPGLSQQAGPAREVIMVQVPRIVLPAAAVLLVGLAAIGASSRSLAQNPATPEGKAAAYVAGLGGQVIVDPKRPGTPVVAVILARASFAEETGNRKIDDSVLYNLRVFRHLQ